MIRAQAFAPTQMKPYALAAHWGGRNVEMWVSDKKRNVSIAYDTGELVACSRFAKQSLFSNGRFVFSDSLGNELFIIQSVFIRSVLYWGDGRKIRLPFPGRDIELAPLSLKLKCDRDGLDIHVTTGQVTLPLLCFSYFCWTRYRFWDMA